MTWKDAVVFGGGMIGLSGFMFMLALMMLPTEPLTALIVAPIPALTVCGFMGSCWFWYWAFPDKE